MKKKIKCVLIFIYHIMAKWLPVKKQKAMFMSNMGRNYSGNVRAIYEQMLTDARFRRVNKIWAFNGDFFNSVKKLGKELLPKGCRIVRYGGIRYYFHMATSGLWIFDTRQEPYLVKRKKNIYFQTWHGTPLKRLGLDIEKLNMAGEDRSLRDYRFSFIQESAKWDYLLVQNDFSEEVLPKCFGFNNTVVKAGYPRNDIFFKKKSPESDNLQGSEASEIMEAKNSGIKPDKKLRLAEEKTRKKKVLLYAPTWRDDEYLGNGFYKCPSRPEFIKLQKELEDEYIIIVKLHYLVKLKKGDIPESCIRSGFVRICGNERDIAELYLRADGLITDYSSVFFDYSVTEKPMFFFCYDLEAYRDKLRGFYLDFEKVAPGPISGDEEQLARDIRNVFGAEREKWQGKIRDFKNWFNTYDDGKAGGRVLNVIAERMGF